MTAAKTGREIALERRMALSKSGKANSDTVVATQSAAPAESVEVVATAPIDARERRRRMSETGKAHVPTRERTRAMVMQASAERDSQTSNPPVKTQSRSHASVVPRSDAQQRRAQLSKYGKAALSAVNSPAEISRTRAQALRAAQSQFGKGVSAIRAERASKTTDQAPQHAHMPVEHARHDVTGTPVAQHPGMTGADRGLCREVTGTEYFSGDVFQALCPRPKSRPESVDQGIQVTGRVATSQLLRPRAHYADDVTADGLTVTGGEAVRSRVTGTDGDRSPRMSGSQYRNTQPTSATRRQNRDQLMASGRLTGHFLDGRNPVTGNTQDLGSDVTGDNYAGNQRTTRAERPSAAPVGGARRMNSGPRISGLNARSEDTTGTPEDVTAGMSGTPYTGSDANPRGRVAHAVTGTQPAVAGGVTGDARGADGPISGTPYVGEDHMADAFGYETTDRPVRQFSVMSKAHAATAYTQTTSGITGSFGKGGGKVTGTDDAPLARPAAHTEPVQPVSHVTGEGATTGQKITGDDWDRNPSVTGTEGPSSTRRNATRRGEEARHATRVNVPDLPTRERPVSKVTGSSGNTSDGALITYSGGARG